MIPLRDVIPSRTTPYITVTIIVVNALVFVFELRLPLTDRARFIEVYGIAPASVGSLSLLTSMFLHGGWLHFLGNMLYLWIFGDNVEDRVGHGRFIVFYLTCGLAATLSEQQIVVQILAGYDDSVAPRCTRRSRSANPFAASGSGHRTATTTATRKARGIDTMPGFRNGKIAAALPRTST